MQHQTVSATASHNLTWGEGLEQSFGGRVPLAALFHVSAGPPSPLHRRGRSPPLLLVDPGTSTGSQSMQTAERKLPHRERSVGAQDTKVRKTVCYSKALPSHTHQTSHA